MWLYRVRLGGTSPAFTVGFYQPDGNWYEESVHSTPQQAAAHVHYLNGGAANG